MLLGRATQGKKALALWREGELRAMGLPPAAALCENRPELRNEAFAAQIFMGASNTRLSLDSAFGRCDGMVAGKYRRARLYLFETPSWLISAHSESGDRGTSWYLTQRNEMSYEGAPNAALALGGYPALGATERQEISQALRSIFLGMCEHAPSEEREPLRRACPQLLGPLLALEERQNLDQALTPGAAPPRKPKGL